MTVAVIATLQVQEDKVDEFVALALDQVAAVAANEPGCSLYTLNRGDDPTSFTFMERYDDDAAFAAHGQTEYFKAFFAAAGEMLAGAPSISLMHEVTPG